MTKILFALLGFLFITISCGPSGPTVRTEGEVGKMRLTILSTYSPDDAGFAIAEDIYRAAKKYPDLKLMMVELQLHVAGGVQDKYGNEVSGSLIMGVIVVDDLDEVRRYRTWDGYAVHLKKTFGKEIRQLDYSYLMDQK